MPKPHVIGLDAGTTGVTALAVGAGGETLGRVASEFPQHFPQPGWVEHDALEIWGTVRTVLAGLYEHSGLVPADAVGLGITNQRETAVVWDRRNGQPLRPAMVWQDRRTTALCERWRADGLEPEVRRRTGLLLDPYFSAPKLRWWIDDGLALTGVAFGTIDAWLLWKLTGHAVHATDFTNASRTLLFDIHARVWSDELLAAFGVPPEWLPEVRASTARFGVVRGVPPLPDGLPIHGMAGDQQAALFGQCCFAAGDWKNTYGTGCFLVLHTGAQRLESRHGLLTTLVCDAAGAPAYGLEGSVFTAGAAVQWLRDGLGIVADAAECERLAGAVPDSGGVYLVPAFTGLGAPHWQPRARAAVLGLSRGSGREHLCRAAIEAIAYQTHDVYAAMCEDVRAGAPHLEFGALRVDGGAARNDLLMQFQADLLGLPVDRPEQIETTAQGAAFLAGLGCGVWPDAGALLAARRHGHRFEPRLAPGRRGELVDGWRKAVRRVLDD
jgi:glycerol kinase